VRQFLRGFNVDLFLSPSRSDVEAAINAEIAAGIVYRPPNPSSSDAEELRIAFDADAVLFSEESEAIFREQGLEAFLRHEAQNADQMLAEGPYAKLLMKLGALQRAQGDERPRGRRTASSGRGASSVADCSRSGLTLRARSGTFVCALCVRDQRKHRSNFNKR